jgi:hypothetical protein
MARLRIPRAQRKRPNRLRMFLPTHTTTLESVSDTINIAFSKGGQRPCTIVLDSKRAQELANTLIFWLPDLKRANP